MKSQTTAKIYQVVPRAQIQQVMGKTLGELKAAVQAQGIAITEPWFTHYSKAPAQNFDFGVCFPVAVPVMRFQWR